MLTDPNSHNIDVAPVISTILMIQHMYIGHLNGELSGPNLYSTEDFFWYAGLLQDYNHPYVNFFVSNLYFTFLDVIGLSYDLVWYGGSSLIIYGVSASLLNHYFGVNLMFF